MLDLPVIVYHDDQDGRWAAWAAHHGLALDALYCPWSHDIGPESLYALANEVHIYLLDFVFVPEVIRNLCAVAAWVTIVDHHEARFAGLISLFEQISKEGQANLTLVLNKDRSAAYLAWQHFNSKEDSIPWPIQYVDDHDCWRHQLSHSHAVNAALTSYGFHPGFWKPMDMLARSPLDLEMGSLLLAEGHAVLRSCHVVVENLLRNRVKVSFPDSPLPETRILLAVNSPCFRSEIGQRLSELMDQDGEPACGAVWWCLPGGKVNWSFRSLEHGPDVSVLARSLGGNGHPHAAGATVLAPPSFVSSGVWRNPAQKSPVS